jgi:pimeloyl-ACP methyl ester carboxylesterase
MMATILMTAHRPRRWFRWPIRLLLALLTLALVLAASGALWQVAATASDHQAFPPPGQLVDVGGRQVHLQISGVDRGLPTVVLEAGVMSASFQWAWVQRDLAEVTRVVSYDRAGLGWSDPLPGERTPQQMVADLHLALERAGISGPYVLVGHSMGGLLVRLFAATYPNEVAGLVLIDPAHPDQLTRLSPAAAEEQLRFRDTLRALPWLQGSARTCQMSSEPLPRRSSPQRRTPMRSWPRWTSGQVWTPRFGRRVTWSTCR